MKFACLVYIEDKKADVPSEAELTAILADCDAAAAWQAELKATGHFVFSVGLQSVRTAKTVRTRGSDVSITDGPFAETKELLGGLTIIEAKDLHEAIQLVAKFRAQMLSIEVRPLLEPGAELTDSSDRLIMAAIARRQTK